MANVLVIAPHPDDEMLGCGGTLLRHSERGDHVHWCIATTMRESEGYNEAQINARKTQIEKVAAAVKFRTVTQFGYGAATLDLIAKSDLVSSFKTVFEKVKPDIIYLPHPSDIHSDHACVFEAAVACTKWFRIPNIKKIYCYEVPSETDFQIDPSKARFLPNVFVDIAVYLDKKIDILQIYETEIAAFPFPRSIEAVRALALLRGSACGCEAAETFQLLKEIIV